MTTDVTKNDLPNGKLKGLPSQPYYHAQHRPTIPAPDKPHETQTLADSGGVV